MCWLEAEHALTDCAAIWHTKRDVGRLERYSNLYERSTARAREVQALPDGDVAHWGRWRNDAWRRVRGVAAELLAGKRGDPCPRAVHWGGPGLDEPRGRMVPARCAGQTSNVFYALRGEP